MSLTRPFYFYNPGLADIRAMTTLGVNVKDKDTAVGFFGTGFKIGVAVALRYGATVTLNVGDTPEPYVFYAVDEVIRGETFQVVHLRNPDGTTHPLGFTTNFGRNWEPWMVYREWRCNSEDESGSYGPAVPDAFDRANGTVLKVDNFAELERAHAERDKYFVSSPPKYDLGSVTVHSPAPDSLHASLTGEKHVFYRDIRVGEWAKPAKYRYNFQESMMLTEDRTAAGPHLLIYKLARWIAMCTEGDFVADVLTADQGYVESALNFAEVYEFSDVFFRVAERLADQHNSKLNLTVLKALVKHRNRPEFRSKEPSVSQSRMLVRAERICGVMGFSTDGVDIRVVDNLGPSVLGKLSGSTILLSERVFSMGSKMVTGTLFEEMIHLRLGLEDESRSMQNWLIDRIMTMHEDANEVLI